MDFFFLKRYDADVIINVVLQLIKQKLPKFVDATPYDIQVLTPMRKGLLGVERLNGILPIRPVYHGIGVSNVRSRIELIGGSSAYLQYRARERGGVIVTVCFPLEIEHMEERKL